MSEQQTSQVLPGPHTRASGWLPAGIAVASVGWGANQFSPLLLLYRNHLGLSAAEVEAIFGVYAVGLVPGLLVGGPTSDRHGRRRVLIVAVLASLVASGLLALGGVGWLYAGRLLAGVASGAAFSSGTAWIRELSGPGTATTASPGPRRATVAMTAGFAAGPLVAGVLAQWGPAPTVLPYLPHLVLAAGATVLVMRLPEVRTPEVRTSGSTRSAGAQRPAPSVGLRQPRFRRVVVPLAPWVFGSASVALAYLPGLLAGAHPGGAAHPDGAANSDGVVGLAALVGTVTALAGIGAQPLARAAQRRGGRAPVALALGLVVVGLLVGAVAAGNPGPLIVVLASVLLGAGYGCAQVVGLAEVQCLAAPTELARVTAVYQAISYLGFAVPFLLAAVEHRLPVGVPLLIAAALAGATLVLTGRKVTR